MAAFFVMNGGGGAEELPAVKAFLEAENKPLQICMLLGHPAVSYRRTAPRRAGDFVMK